MKKPRSVNPRLRYGISHSEARQLLINIGTSTMTADYAADAYNISRTLVDILIYQYDPHLQSLVPTNRPRESQLFQTWATDPWRWTFHWGE